MDRGWASMISSTMLKLSFDRGTLLLRGCDTLPEVASGVGFRFDERVDAFRTPARGYRACVEAFVAAGLEFEDEARAYEKLELRSHAPRQPYPHQVEAVDDWWKKGRSGVVVLPTGSGKTHVAEMIMIRLGVSTLVVTPTIDLMQQWYGSLRISLGVPVGLLGGGSREVEEITVTTYDSAWTNMEHLGDRFGLLVFDECHHLPGPSYALAAELSIAPHRLGLTATPEREDGQQARYPYLVGPTVYRKEINDLAGEILADYETVRLEVPLNAGEREEYERERALYRDFVSESGISLGSPGGWARFLAATCRSSQGRRALAAFRRHKQIAQASEGKQELLCQLLERHRGDRVLIFTSDNATVYRISRSFLIAAITHQTKVKERHEILERFNSGEYGMLVTSKVLNEGVDIPEANVAIVLSGSGSVREHVQRLGRILRRRGAKQALLYEVVAEGTSEESQSARRRRHSAYR